MAFEWKQNLACGSAYKVLEALHQFNASKLSFERAADVKLRRLTYFPASTSSEDILRMSAMLLVQQYAQLLDRFYVLRPHGAGTWKDLMADMQAVLEDGDNTIAVLASTVDEYIRFQDER